MNYPSSFGELSYDDHNKKRFLSVTARLLRAVGKHFSNLLVQVRSNAGGIAVGGDVYLSIEDEKKQLGVLITITHTGFGGNRDDGVVGYIQYRLPDIKGKLTRIPNLPNRYFSEFNEERITHIVQDMLAGHPA